MGEIEFGGRWINCMTEEEREKLYEKMFENARLKEIRESPEYKWNETN